MSSEIHLPLADGGTCTVSRESLLISRFSPPIWRDCLGESFGAALFLVIVIFGERIGLPIGEALEFLWALAFVVVLAWAWQHRKRWRRASDEEAIQRDEIDSLKWSSIRLRLEYRRSGELFQCSLEFTDPQDAQAILKSLGWETET